MAGVGTDPHEVIISQYQRHRLVVTESTPKYKTPAPVVAPVRGFRRGKRLVTATVAGTRRIRILLLAREGPQESDHWFDGLGGQCVADAIRALQADRIHGSAAPSNNQAQLIVSLGLNGGGV